MQRSSSNDYRKFTENKTCVVVKSLVNWEVKGCAIDESFEIDVKPSCIVLTSQCDLGTDILYCPPVGKALVDIEASVNFFASFHHLNRNGKLHTKTFEVHEES